MIKSLGILNIFLLLVLTIAFCYADNIRLPEGWRLPFDSETDQEWRNENDNRYLSIIGDFNGDGVADIAKLLISADGECLRLYAFVSQKKDIFKLFLLDEVKGKNKIQAMGIVKVLPGEYTTACGKGYWECDRYEKPKIRIHFNAINYFKIESANSYFYWDKKNNKFKRIWMSD